MVETVGLRVIFLLMILLGLLPLVLAAPITCLFKSACTGDEVDVLRISNASLGYNNAHGRGNDPAPNCVATEELAEPLWGQLYPAHEDNPFPRGCAGNPDAYKPESKTLMSRFPDPTWEYGTFNTWYLNAVLTCCYSQEAEPACNDFLSLYDEWEGCRT